MSGENKVTTKVLDEHKIEEGPSEGIKGSVSINKGRA